MQHGNAEHGRTFHCRAERDTDATSEQGTHKHGPNNK